jgi:phospholipid N-methyltransferase
MLSTWTYLKRFAQSPAEIGSIVPSSRFLVARMMDYVDWDQTDTIIELGAGTGVMTAAIENLRSANSTFISFERDDSLRDALNLRFPDVLTHHDAFLLPDVLASQSLNSADCIISCLPFANFDDASRKALFADIHAALRPGGVFVAFQYTRLLQPYFLSVYGRYECKRVLINVPPALVYFCTKQ